MFRIILIALLSMFLFTGCSNADLNQEKAVMPAWLKTIKTTDVDHIGLSEATITNADESGTETIQKLIVEMQQSTPISGNGFYESNNSGVVIYLKNGEQIHVTTIFPHVNGDVSVGFDWSMVTLNGEIVYLQDSKKNGTNFWNTISEYKNQHTLLITIDPKCGNLNVAKEVQNYLKKVSDPKIINSFIIKNVGQDRNSQYWVELLVRHQAGSRSSYKEGVNKRYIEYSITGDSFIVTGLVDRGDLQ